MKKIGISVMLVVAIFVCVFALTACGVAQKVKVFDAYELTSEGYAFCVTKGETQLLNTANELLSELKDSGELDSIIKSFFYGTSTFTYKNPVKTPPANDDKYLIVATNSTFPPFEYTIGDKFTGIDIEIASLLAKKMGKTLYVYDMEFDAVIKTVQTGNVCNIGMAGITVNDDRKKMVDFTDIYYESAQVLVVRSDDTVFTECKSADDIINLLKQQDKNFKLGAQYGTTGFMFSYGDDGFGYEGFDNLTTSGYSAGALAVVDLSNGRINAVIIDRQPALMIAKQINAGIKE